MTEQQINEFTQAFKHYLKLNSSEHTSTTKELFQRTLDQTLRFTGTKLQ